MCFFFLLIALVFPLSISMQMIIPRQNTPPNPVQPAHRPPTLERLLPHLALPPTRLYINAHLVVHRGQRRGAVFLAQGLVPRLVVDLPELGLRVVRVGVEPLAAAELDELVLEGAVLGDELVVVLGAPAPDANVEHRLGNNFGGGAAICSCDGFRLAGWVESRAGRLLEGTQPKRPDAELVGSVVDELGGLVVRNGEVLDDEPCGLAAGVQRAVEHAGVHEVVEEPAPEARERHVLEVGEALGADPEARAVVAEEVLGERDVVGDGIGVGVGVGVLGAVLDV